MKRFLLLWLLVITAILSSCDKKSSNGDYQMLDNIQWDNISANDYELSPDEYILIAWRNNDIEDLDMRSEDYLKKVEVIGYKAFYRNTNLYNVIISSSVTKIGNEAFSECTNLTNINIPNSVKLLGDNAFSYCKNLKSINIPRSVKKLGYGVFAGCTQLKYINMPNSVTNIGSGAFSGCKSLESINIPNSVTSIALGVFYECTSLRSISIPSSVTSIGEYAFKECTNLESITIRSPQIITYTEGLLANTPKLKNIYVPANLVEGYKNANGWSYFADKIKAIED